MIDTGNNRKTNLVGQQHIRKQHGAPNNEPVIWVSIYQLFIILLGMVCYRLKHSHKHANYI